MSVLVLEMTEWPTTRKNGSEAIDDVSSNVTPLFKVLLAALDQ